MNDPDGGLTIRDVAARTGVGQPTLRMWETRYGFPVPVRRPSGHRRYSEGDVELIRQVVRDREAGLALPAAIERARASEPPGDESIFAALRSRRPDLVPHVLPKRILIALSHAIEDECCARAERPVLFASFQRESFYRHAESRWRELNRTAQVALVLADFPEVRRPEGAPIEVPIPSEAPINREWSLVCDAPDYSVCLSAWEHPGQERVADGDRRFETIWSVEPDIVRTAARIAAGLVEDGGAELPASASDQLAGSPPPSSEEMRIVGALTNRMVAYIGGAETTSLPEPHS